MNMELESLSDIELIKLTLAGNCQAFRIIYDRYSPLVLHYCLAIIHNKDMAEDLTQDTFLRILEKIHLFDCDGKNANFKGWVTTIAFRIAVNYRYQESHKRKVLSNLIDNENIKAVKSHNPKDRLEKKEFEDILLTALEELPEPTKTCIIDHYVHRMRRKDICRAYGLTIGQVDHYLDRGRRLLRKKLGD